jgi:hypothetical protein
MMAAIWRPSALINHAALPTAGAGSDRIAPKPGQHFRVRFAATTRPNEPSKIGE